MNRGLCPDAHVEHGTRELRANANTLLAPRHIRRDAALLLFVLLVVFPARIYANPPENEQEMNAPLKHLSLQDLAQIEVTTAPKVPVKATRTPAAIYVITQEDIRRSGATSIPEALRLAPGVEVARVDSNTWSLGVRGFESTLSRSVLVLIAGRSVYTPLFAGVYWQVHDTPVEEIERIEIIPDPGGPIFGGEAVNPVVTSW